MREFLGCMLVVIALLFPVLSFAEAPQQIAGIRLGAPIDQYRDLLRMEYQSGGSAHGIPVRSRTEDTV